MPVFKLKDKKRQEAHIQNSLFKVLKMKVDEFFRSLRSAHYIHLCDYVKLDFRTSRFVPFIQLSLQGKNEGMNANLSIENTKELIKLLEEKLNEVTNQKTQP